MAKLVMDFLGAPRSVSASDNLDVMKTALKANPGVGNPFLYFATGVLASGQPATVDYNLHPDWAGHGNVVNSDETVNKQMMQAMLANPPTDAVTF